MTLPASIAPVPQWAPVRCRGGIPRKISNDVLTNISMTGT
jgi:hypothetical protein